jgi:hypothetical protein
VFGLTQNIDQLENVLCCPRKLTFMRRKIIYASHLHKPFSNALPYFEQAMVERPILCGLPAWASLGLLKQVGPIKSLSQLSTANNMTDNYTGHQSPPRESLLFSHTLFLPYYLRCHLSLSSSQLLKLYENIIIVSQYAYILIKHKF